MIAPVVPLPKSQFDIDLATSADDLELRQLLRRNPIPGPISIIFEREPSFFDSCRIRGDFVQVGVGRDRRTGKIVGLGTRSIASAFVNGNPTPVGNLADLRLEPAYRGGTLIARGYRFLKYLHEDGRTKLYTTMIFAGNHAALKTIASGRAGLPRYHDMGVIHSPGIKIRRTRPAVCADCEILRGSEELLPEIVECLNRNNARRQFAPVHTVAMFKERWREFRAADFVVAVRGSRVIGALGCWDQTPFKQTRIVGYAPPLRWLLPVANALSPLTRSPRFPIPGEKIPYFHIGFIAVDGDDLRVFRSLLRFAYNEAVGGRYLYAILALHEHDPLLPVLREYSRTAFSGRLFCVTFDDGEKFFPNLDGRIPYLEAATF
jgi:hypothetical protein